MRTDLDAKTYLVMTGSKGDLQFHDMKDEQFAKKTADDLNRLYGDGKYAAASLPEVNDMLSGSRPKPVAHAPDDHERVARQLEVGPRIRSAFALSAIQPLNLDDIIAGEPLDSARRCVVSQPSPGRLFHGVFMNADVAQRIAAEGCTKAGPNTHLALTKQEFVAMKADQAAWPAVIERSTMNSLVDESLLARGKAALEAVDSFKPFGLGRGPK